MFARMLRIGWLGMFASSISLSSAFGGVRIVDSSGDRVFTTLQAAVDAASNGDVLLVGAGNYAPFTLTGKALSILAVPGAQVAVLGRISIHDVAQGSIVIRGLAAVGTFDLEALTISNVAASLEFDACSFVGGVGEAGPGGAPAPNGANVSAASKLAFVGCTLGGSPGGDDLSNHATGHDGGRGAKFTSSNVALYECTLSGGVGGEGDDIGGNGGIGCSTTSGFLFTSKSRFTGGDGGVGDFVFNGIGANALYNGYSGPASTVWALDTLFVGGTGYCGNPGCHFQADGVGGSPITTIAGSARKLAANAVQSDALALVATFTGQPGDKVWFELAPRDGFHANFGDAGVWIPRYPSPLGFAGTVGASGTLSIHVDLASLGASTVTRALFGQALAIDATGKRFLSTPIQVQVLGEHAGPDCDGDGVDDFVQVVNGTVPDVNHDLVSDICLPIWNGPTWSVDVNGPALGNGSPSLPFRTLGAAFDAAANQGTIEVADGTYVGPDNRNLDFGGRDLRVVGLHGPAHCVIDCQGLGRAFTVSAPAGSDSLIAGFAIENGDASQAPDAGGSSSFGGGIAAFSASPLIVGCTIENCRAESGAGIYFSGTSGLVQDCVVSSNHGIGTQSRGGGIECFVSGVSIVHCIVQGNSATDGGGIWSSGSHNAQPAERISQSAILGNTATSGGGVFMFADGFHLQIDDCVIAGNIADWGGALNYNGNSSALDVANCTFASNIANHQGASMYTGGANATLANSIFWGDQSNAATNIVAWGSAAHLSINYCDVQGGQAATSAQSFAQITWGAGNLASDPKFTSIGGADGNPFTVGDNDYHLTLASPCIDAASNPSEFLDVLDLDADGNVVERVPFDLDFHARFVDVATIPDAGVGPAPVIDMGAFEHP